MLEDKRLTIYLLNSLGDKHEFIPSKRFGKLYGKKQGMKIMDLNLRSPCDFA
jgi:hypothetical protein